MRKLFILITLFALLCPLMRPLAHSCGAGEIGDIEVEVCSTTAHECRHGDSCPMNSATKKRAQCHLNGGHSKEEARRHRCDTYFECSTAADPEFFTPSLEMPFVLSTLFFDKNELYGPGFTAAPAFYPAPAPALPERPPCVD